MNLSQFYKLAKFLVKAYDNGGIEAAYQNLHNAMQNQINSPNQQHLENLSLALDDLKVAVEKAGYSRMPPTWKPLIDELGIGDYAGSVIHTWARRKINESGPVLTDAQKALGEDFKNLKEHYQHLRASIEALDYLEYPEERLKPGEAEVLIKLPRELFKNEVGEFAARVRLFDHIISTCAEAAGHSGERIQLKEISTTDPILVAIATPATVLFVLKVVNQILDAYKKVVEIREIQQRTKAAGLKDTIVQEISAEAERIVQEALTKFIASTKKQNKLNNELTEKLKKMAFKLAAMIDHGARVEGWAIPSKPAEEGEETEGDATANETLEAIRQLGQELRQFAGAEEPILSLPPPNDEESDT